jgi:hypothetical protein
MNQGLYEELATKLINYKLNELDKDTFQVKKTSIDKAETTPKPKMKCNWTKCCGISSTAILKTIERF